MPQRPKSPKPMAKLPVAPKSPKNQSSKVRALEKRLAEALKREAEAQGQLQIWNRELVEARAHRAATSEILNVISSSPTDVQPVFDAIVRNAVRLCNGFFGVVTRYDGRRIGVVAKQNLPAEVLELFTFTTGSITGRALESREVVHVHDAMREAERPAALAKAAGYRTIISVPLLREGQPIGTINVARREMRPFSDTEIDLLKTFADQAVIAIENVRLFKETKEALEQQTATSEILGVISQSQTDVQPVLDVIAANAVRLCDGYFSAVYVSDGARLHVRATHNLPPEWREAAAGVYPAPLDSNLRSVQTVREQRVIHVLDVQEVGDAESRHRAQISGYHTWIGVPMVAGSGAVGTIAVARRERRAFSENDIALLKTFADQAVIAIENVRLFTELQEKNQALTQAHAQVSESLDQQTATSEILRVISSSPTDVQPVFDTIAQSAVRLCDAIFGAVYRVEGGQIHMVAQTGIGAEGLARALRMFPMPLGESAAVARAIFERSVVQVSDIEAPQAPRLTREVGRAIGFRSQLTVPMLRNGEPIGVVNVARREPGAFSQTHVELLMTFADQAVIAIENVRLFKELAAANRELAAASQHKSEFLANMSHELRTPLNAIIGFSEVLSEKMFGELNQKQEEYSKDIHASGQHLLSLINDILDLSKIEAGRMELELSDFDVPTAIDNALTLVRERAGRRNITLQMSVDECLGEVQADERKIRQVVLNLLSNAIKFTPEGGRIEVLAAPKGGLVEVSVSDTGVGIAPEDQEAVFEEFRQVGTAEKKAEGTGLGLTLCRKFVELHGGRIRVKSQVGMGSTFTFTIPVRRGE
jgi:two-component system, NtrC family, sensor kinase